MSQTSKGFLVDIRLVSCHLQPICTCQNWDVYKRNNRPLNNEVFILTGEVFVWRVRQHRARGIPFGSHGVRAIKEITTNIWKHCNTHDRSQMTTSLTTLWNHRWYCGISDGTSQKICRLFGALLTQPCSMCFFAGLFFTNAALGTWRLTAWSAALQVLFPWTI